MLPLSPVVDRLRRTLRGRNALLNVFELWVGMAGIVTGIVFFYKPAAIDQSAVSQAVGHTVSLVWNIGYFLAGLLIWYGLLRPDPRWETVALWAIGTFTSIEAIAIWAVFGFRGSATAILLVSLTGSAWIRATLVTHAARQLSEMDVGGGRGGGS